MKKRFMLAEATGLPVRVAENPLFCVALGTGMALEQLVSGRKNNR